MDGKNNVKISTSFLKSEDGGAWSVRVEGDAIEEGELYSVWVRNLTRTGKPSRTSLIYHLGLEGLGQLRLETEGDDSVSTSTKLEA